MLSSYFTHLLHAKSLKVQQFISSFILLWITVSHECCRELWLSSAAAAGAGGHQKGWMKDGFKSRCTRVYVGTVRDWEREAETPRSSDAFYSSVACYGRLCGHLWTPRSETPAFPGAPGGECLRSVVFFHSTLFFSQCWSGVSSPSCYFFRVGLNDFALPRERAYSRIRSKSPAAQQKPEDAGGRGLNTAKRLILLLRWSVSMVHPGDGSPTLPLDSLLQMFQACCNT